MINDPAGGSQIWTDDQIQDVSDESRLDVVNMPLKPTITYDPTIQYLNYFSDIGGWETDYVILQNYGTTVVPSSAEPIAGKFTFSTNTYPTLTISGKQHDVYHAAADLLERLAAQSVLQFSFSSDGQSFHPEQVISNVERLVKMYRSKQRPATITVRRSDLARGRSRSPLDPRPMDYVGLGDP